MSTNLLYTEKQKKGQSIIKQILGLMQSHWNIVMFKDDPKLWFQYFAGIFMNMPTIIVIKKTDADFIPVLKRTPLVKAVFEVETFDENYASDIADKIAHFIKKHPDQSI